MLMKFTFIILLVTAIALFLQAPFLTVAAQVMESGNYRIQFDSINVGGGLSTSTSYALEDTTGELATGESESASYQLKAGYQQMNEVYLAITAASDVTLSPSIGGVTGGTANGSTAVTVTTDSRSGYELTIKASTSPAMESNTSSATIADYTPAGAAPDYAFSVPATTAEFAFTPEGSDLAQRYLNNGSNTCNAGSTDTADACWDALSTSARTIATRTSSNHPSGTQTTIKFRLESGTSHIQEAGTYTATTTLTALPL